MKQENDSKMNITKHKLSQIIKEELNAILHEADEESLPEEVNVKAAKEACLLAAEALGKVDPSDGAELVDQCVWLLRAMRKIGIDPAGSILQYLDL